MPCDVRDVAQYIVNYFIQCDNPVTNLKLQKLLYFSWIDYFKAKKEYLFNEEFEAWVLGPVVPEAYYEFCAYGADMIFRCKEVHLSGTDTEIIDKTLEKYSAVSPYELVEISHRPGGAWDKIFSGGKGRRKIIDFETVKKLECSI